MKHKPFVWFGRFLHWWFGAPFQKLPPEFGDPVPTELRVFAARVEEIQHRSQSQKPLPPLAQHERV